MPNPPDERHYRTVIDGLMRGRVIPFLGAGVNLAARRDGEAFRPGEYLCLPNGRELASHLAGVLDRVGHRARNVDDLLLVSQDVEVIVGQASLYEELREVFNGNYPTTPLHDFFAGLPKLLKALGSRTPYQLIVTTNYDDVLENAFREFKEPFDLVKYVAAGRNRGKFWHIPPGGEGEAVLIESPEEYSGEKFDLAKRTVILKIHGAVDRDDPDGDSYVITEDHYINFLVHAEGAGFLPVGLQAKLSRGSFLFLGYGLRDWNLRVLLYRIWGEQNFKTKSWAVQLDPDELDERFWQQHDVELFDERLSGYIEELSRQLAARMPAGVGA